MRQASFASKSGENNTILVLIKLKALEKISHAGMCFAPRQKDAHPQKRLSAGLTNPIAMITIKKAGRLLLQRHVIQVLAMSQNPKPEFRNKFKILNSNDQNRSTVAESFVWNIHF